MGRDRQVWGCPGCDATGIVCSSCFRYARCQCLCVPPLGVIDCDVCQGVGRLTPCDWCGAATGAHEEIVFCSLECRCEAALEAERVAS
jgi:hypothetical protein